MMMKGSPLYPITVATAADHVYWSSNANHIIQAPCEGNLDHFVDQLFFYYQMPQNDDSNSTETHDDFINRSVPDELRLKFIHRHNLFRLFLSKTIINQICYSHEYRDAQSTKSTDQHG